MKKNLAIMLVMALSINPLIQAHGGGGGGSDWGPFLGGVAVGTLATSAATSNRGDRDPAYYDYKSDQADRRREDRKVENQKKEVKSLEKEIKVLHKDIDRLNKRKDLSNDERKKRISEKETNIKDKEDRRDSLKDSIHG